MIKKVIDIFLIECGGIEVVEGKLVDPYIMNITTQEHKFLPVQGILTQI